MMANSIVLASLDLKGIAVLTVAALVPAALFGYLFIRAKGSGASQFFGGEEGERDGAGLVVGEGRRLGARKEVVTE